MEYDNTYRRDRDIEEGFKKLSRTARRDIYRVRKIFREAKARIDLALEKGIKNSSEYEIFIKNKTTSTD